MSLMPNKVIKTTLVISSMLVFGVGSVFAQDAIADRKAQMKQVGGAAGVVGKMMKGQADFDAAAALAAFTTMNKVAAGYGDLFPDGTESGDTKAGPAIWSDREGFEAAVAKFEADTAAAIEAAPADLDALKVSFGAVSANCGACHQKYRIK